MFGWIGLLLIIVVMFEYWPSWVAGVLGVLMVFAYLGYLAEQAEQKAKLLANANASDNPSAGMTQPTQLMQLLLLQREYRLHPHRFSEAPEDFEQHLEQAIDKTLDAAQLTPLQQQQALEAAWQWLQTQTEESLGNPLWHQTEPPATTTGQPNASTIGEQPDNQIVRPETIQATQIPAPSKESIAAVYAKIDLLKQQGEIGTVVDYETPPLQPSTIPTPRVTTRKPPPKPTQASPRKKSVFLQLLLPFLWQNIGWFIGGFCFVSGSTFLVTYTSGSIQALFVILTLLLYSGLLLWGGYQIHRHRPELRLASSVLVSISLLLVPLTLAASVGWSQTALQIPALGLSLLLLGIGYFMARVASSIIEGSFSQTHALLFSLLSSVQLFTPLIAWQAHWTGLALAHLALWLILAYTLYRFAQDWLKRIFVEQQYSSYYAVGTLFYAALVSFIHLAWGSGLTVSNGYYGVALIALTTLLFYADIQLKRWVPRYPVLDHFTFVIYALSGIAVLLAVHEPLLLTLTLVLTTLLYAAMLLIYLSVPLLYLFIASISALYASLVLRHVLPELHFLAALPLFSFTIALYQLGVQRDKSQFATVSCRLAMALASGLLVWSLYHTAPGYLATLTALTATAMSLLVLRLPTTQQQACTGLSSPLSFYLPASLLLLTGAYSPVLWETWAWQFAHVLLLFSGGWTLVLASRLSRLMPHGEVIFNLALLQILLSLGLTALVAPADLPTLALLAIPVTVGLSLVTRTQLVWYLALLLGSGMLLWFSWQHPSLLFATGIFGGALLLWLSVLGLQRVPHQAGTDLGYRLWHLAPLPMHRSVIGSITQPLLQWLWFCWLVGIGQLVLMALVMPLDSTWLLPLLLATGLTLVLAGHWGQYGLLPLVLLLSHLILLVGLPRESLTLFAWVASSVLLGILIPVVGHRMTWFKELNWRLQRDRAESVLHFTLVFSLLLALALNYAIALYGADFPFEPLLAYHADDDLYASLLLSTGFLLWTGWLYQQPLHSYLVLGLLSSLAIFGYADVQGLAYLDLLMHHPLTPVLAGLAILFAQLAYSSQQLPRVGDKALILYYAPLTHFASVWWVLALSESLQLLFVAWQQGLPATPALPLFFVLLAVGTLPGLRLFHLPDAPLLRGILTAILLSLAFISSVQGFAVLNLPLYSVAWGFAVWAIAVYGLSWFNRYVSYWAIEPHPWLGVGLFAQLGSIALVLTEGDINVWWMLAAVTLYLHLLVWQYRYAAFAWLAALGLLLTGSSLLWTIFIAETDGLLSFEFNDGVWLILSHLLWLNLLVLFSHLIVFSQSAHHLQAILHRLLSRLIPVYHDASVGLQTPIFSLCFGVMLLGLAVNGLLLGLTGIFSGQPFGDLSEWRLITAALVLSLLHLAWLKPRGLTVHPVLFAVLQFGWLLTPDWPLPIIIASALIGINLLAIAPRGLGRWSLPAVFTEATMQWRVLLFYLAVASLIAFPWFAQDRLTLLIIVSILVIHSIAWRWQLWTVGLLLILLHGHWPLWLPSADAWLYLPWVAVQNTVILALLLTIQRYGGQRIGGVLSRPLYVPLFTLLSQTQTLLAMGFYAITRYQFGSVPQLYPFDWLLTVVSGVLLIALWLLYNPWRIKHISLQVYALAVMIFLLLAFLRIGLWGYTPFSLWDTTALILLGYALVLWQYWVPHPALKRLSYALPLFALLTVPWQLASLQASGALVAIATLYLLLPCKDHCRGSLLAGLSVLNIALYLWVPALADHTNLVQVYTLPAALTVLFMLHAHKQALSPSTAHHLRLAALGAVYASVGADLFFRPELEVFALALLLAMLGVIVGIALRLKAFLYTATLFIVINVVVQLIHYTPEDTVGKAIILMVLGGVITVGMILFSLQREAIMRRVQGVWDHLAEWE